MAPTTTPLKGAAAGLPGGAVMTAVEKAEQAVTGAAELLRRPAPRRRAGGQGLRLSGRS